MHRDPGTGKRKSIAARRSPSNRHSFEGTSVRLIRKYAEMIDGVDLEDAAVGDRLALSKRDAAMLIAEGWAEHVEAERRVRLLPRRAVAADSTRQSPRKSRK